MKFSRCVTHKRKIPPMQHSDGHFSDKKVVEYLNRNDRKIQLDRNEGLY
jgi:hypothetical protein